MNVHKHARMTMHGKYVILCNQKGGVLNDPVLLRLSEDEFWFSVSDSDLMFWLQGINVGKRFDVDINEIDVAPAQVQGPKSTDLMADLVGEEVGDMWNAVLEAGENHNLMVGVALRHHASGLGLTPESYAKLTC